MNLVFSRSFVIARFALFSFVCCISVSANGQKSWKFDFGDGKAATGYVLVKSNTVYSNAQGFGFESAAGLKSVDRKGKDALKGDYVTSASPFFFSVNVPEGNYNVKLFLGDVAGQSSTIVRAECRRAVLPQIITKQGEVKAVSFTVHVRDTLIAGSTKHVRIKERERLYLHWDNKLTIEFNDSLPKICGIEISEATNIPTVFLAGNSTVVDQAAEPYAAWGQMIPQFFEPGKVAIANYAESGESLTSFFRANRLDKILSLMKPGDYLFIEMAHNDQKQKGDGIGPWTSYTNSLKQFIAACRQKGGNPVLVTSMHRRNFDKDGKVINTLGDYPAAMRKVAEDEKVPLIDLNNMSATLYEAWGPTASEKAFVIYPANSFPGQDKALLDNTHFNPYGALQIAKCIAEGMRDLKLPLANLLRKSLPLYNPAKPDNVSEFYWPLSPVLAIAKPDGN